MHDFHVRSDIQEYLAKAVLKDELRILRQRRIVRLLRFPLALFSILERLKTKGKYHAN